MPERVICIALCLLLAACEGAPETTSASGGLRLANILGAESVDGGFERAEQPRPFVFPVDHAAHPDYRSEWWYLTLVLEAQGRTYGVQFTLFRQALFPASSRPDAGPWDNGQFYLAHFALTDVHRGVHREFERFSRGHPQLAGTRAEPFAAWIEDWRLEALGDGFRLVAGDTGHGVSVDLSPQKAMVLRGEEGLSRKGPGQASFYYSIPRLRATGELVFDGVTHSVQGLGWFDREWSTSMLDEAQVGWDWFALMLDSGEDLSVFQLRRSDGARDPFDHGVIVAEDGRVKPLAPDSFRLTPLQFWRDDRMVRWPVVWSLEVQDRRYTVKAMVDDQRMDTLITYWEGVVEVLDEDGASVGAGYMELTGY